jgi:hypothetical protein
MTIGTTQNDGGIGMHRRLIGLRMTIVAARALGRCIFECLSSGRWRRRHVSPLDGNGFLGRNRHVDRLLQGRDGHDREQGEVQLLHLQSRQ